MIITTCMTAMLQLLLLLLVHWDCTTQSGDADELLANAHEHAQLLPLLLLLLRRQPRQAASRRSGVTRRRSPCRVACCRYEPANHMLEFINTPAEPPQPCSRLLVQPR